MQENVEHFISDLYLSAARIAPESYRLWGLEQLQRMVKFDAAFWGTGRLHSRLPNYIEHMGLDDQYSERLAKTLDINPIKDAVLSRLGKPVLMSEVYEDDKFYQSPLYEQLFQPYGIKRVLASGHFDNRSGLYTLLSLYRHNRDDDFTEEEKDLIARLIFHLVAAASYSFFLHLERTGSLAKAKEPDENMPMAWAICDAEGYYHEVQARFLDFVEQYFPDAARQRLPFWSEGLKGQEKDVINGLAVTLERHQKLYLVGIRPASVIDQLTDREREVVSWITQGLTYKEVARKIGLAPSTVSNHLYRVYNKLGISSKTELVQLKAQFMDA